MSARAQVQSHGSASALTAVRLWQKCRGILQGCLGSHFTPLNVPGPFRTKVPLSQAGSLPFTLNSKLSCARRAHWGPAAQHRRLLAVHIASANLGDLVRQYVLCEGRLSGSYGRKRVSGRACNLRLGHAGSCTPDSPRLLRRTPLSDPTWTSNTQASKLLLGSESHCKAYSQHSLLLPGRKGGKACLLLILQQ